MKLKEKISWMMGRLQRSLFPCLEECCISPLTEQEKQLVKTLEVIEIERHIHNSRVWTGRPPAERKAIGRCYVAKAVCRYQHTRTLIHELQARPISALSADLRGRRISPRNRHSPGPLLSLPVPIWEELYMMPW